MDWQSLFFSFRGRINRARYWLALLVFLVLDIVLGLVGWVLGNAVAFQILSSVVNLAVFISGIAVCIKRLHDRDRSGWWLMLFYFGTFVFVLMGGFLFWASPTPSACRRSGRIWDFGFASSPVLLWSSGVSWKSAAGAAPRDITASGRTAQTPGASGARLIWGLTRATR